jgi:hypothetical protein
MAYFEAVLLVKMVVENIHDNQNIISFLYSIPKKKWNSVFFHSIVEKWLSAF